METIQIDGSYGEGGGQVLRTSLALAALTGRPLEIVHIRAGRTKPGLRPQHLTAVRAAAAICAAEVRGDALNSQRLIFRPSRSSAGAGGDYCFDVRDTAQGGSAGSMTLVAQTVLLPLALAGLPSQVTLLGGTHVPWSPPFHFMRNVFLPVAGRVGLRAKAKLQTWGWYPVGKGEFSLAIQPSPGLSKLEWTERGELVRVTGVAAATNLPAHIPQRMADRARNLLRDAGIPSQIRPVRERGPAAGAGIFLTAEYANGPAGFAALGRRGRPAEKVAQDACAGLLRHHAGDAPVDRHLADQLILPLALAAGESAFRTGQITPHTLTNIHIVQQFLDISIRVEHKGDGGLILITGHGLPCWK